MWSNRHSLGLFNLILGKALRIPLWIGVSAAIARLLGPEGLGKWSMILAAGMFLNQFFLHWTQSITQRFARQCLLEQGSISGVLVQRIPLLLVGLGGAFATLCWLPGSWAENLFGVERSVDALLAMLAFWFMAEAQSIQQVQERFGRLAWSPIGVDLLLLVVVFTLFSAADFIGGMGVREKLICLLLVMLVGWLFFLLSELRSSNLMLSQPDFSRLSAMAVFAVPLIPGFLVAYFSEWCDYFLIRHFYGDHEVGLFHSAYQYLLILIGIPTALVSVLLPGLVSLYDRQESRVLDRFLAFQAPQFSFAWGILILIPLAILPWMFELLLGEGYQSSVGILAVLLVAVPGAVVQHVYGIAYFLRGRLVVSTFLFFMVKLLINFAVSWSLLPVLGIQASALGVVVSYCVLQWLFVLFAIPGRRVGKNGAMVLAWCQVSGLLLCFFEPALLRMAIAAFWIAATMCVLRYSGLFEAKEISRALPRWLRRYEALILRWLCGSQMRDAI